MSSPTDSRPGLPTASTAEPANLAIGGPSDAGAKLRVGLIGLDRSGQFHAERLSLRSEIEIIAASEPSSAGPWSLPGPRAADRPVYSRPDDLLARTDIDTVLIAGPTESRAEWAMRALEANKHVALDAPPCANAGQLHDLLAAARRTGKRVSVLPTRRVGSDFRTAAQIVRGGQLGRIYSARLLSWGKAVPDSVGGSPASDRTAEREHDPFAFFAYQYVDQLLQLMGGRPQSVFGRILAPSQDAAAGTVFSLAIGFEPGIDALIDVNLQSGAVLQTGWMLASDRGGYSGGRIFLQESTGEISDAPVLPNDQPDIDVYGELVAHVRGETGLTASAVDAELVMRVLDAARESSRSGQTISIEP